MALTGSQKFAVLLCKFSDSADTEPRSVAFMQDLCARRGTGGLNDYWIAASLGNDDGSPEGSAYSRSCTPSSVVIATRDRVGSFACYVAFGDGHECAVRSSATQGALRRRRGSRSGNARPTRVRSPDRARR